MTWIDFRKAFDSLSHEWIFSCLDLYKINRKTSTVIKKAFSLFETTVMYKKKVVGEVNLEEAFFKEIIYISLLLFVMPLFPMSLLLNQSNKGYKFSTHKNKFCVNHLSMISKYTAQLKHK